MATSSANVKLAHEPGRPPSGDPRHAWSSPPLRSAPAACRYPPAAPRSPRAPTAPRRGSANFTATPTVGTTSRDAYVDNVTRISCLHFRRFWHRLAMVQHDPGLTASPPCAIFLECQGAATLLAVPCRLWTPMITPRPRPPSC